MNILSNAAIKALVLDVLKPHTPSLPEFAEYLIELDGVNKVDITLVEMDERTESLKVVIQGHDIEFENLKEYMGKRGAVIHSIDQVVVEK
ncbi:MAG TPA: DUF211 domain-containing protein [Patescibacteria group bacterium]|nr:DUF211 domain-containing protein [Patescibacteria group bacterium]